MSGERLQDHWSSGFYISTGLRGSFSHGDISMMCFMVIPPANCVCGRVYCFHVVSPSDRASVTFCFLNILKNH